MTENKNTSEEENVDVEKLPMLNVGMVGHIDHGKTTLLYKLSGKWTDTHSEELKRGITIKLGYAETIVRNDNGVYNNKQGKPVLYASFIDVPGHEMLMATMLSGAAMIDVAILVIAANEGIKPQTREHLVALQAKKIKNIIVVQNKIDLVPLEQAKKNYQEIKEFLKGTLAEDAPVIPISAQQEINLDKIFEALCAMKIPERDVKGEPFFIVARSFDVNRPGTAIHQLKGGVLGGALRRGILKVGDEIEIKPGMHVKKENQLIYDTVKTKILSIHLGNISIKEATPGGSLAIETELDPFLTKADTLAGCLLGLKDRLPVITSTIKLKFNLFKEVLGIQERRSVAAVHAGELLLLSVSTAITIGNVIRAKGNEAELSLRIPIVPFKGENVGIARNVDGHWRLVGFGELV